MSYNMICFKLQTFGNVTNIKVAGSADSENKQSIVSYGYDSKQRNNTIKPYTVVQSDSNDRKSRVPQPCTETP